MFSSVTLVASLEALRDVMAPTKSYLVLAGEDFPFDAIESTTTSPWMGGVFPAVFTTHGLETSKAFVCELGEDASLLYCSGKEERTLGAYQSYLVLVNGFDPKAGNVLDALFENTASGSVLFGGGAGCLTKACALPLFNGSKYCNDGIVLVASPKLFHADSKHGYEAFANFSVISKAHENIIEEIDFRSAFDVYKQTLHEETGLEVTPENIFQMGVKHPLVFERAFGEKTLRVPVATNGKNIQLVGDAMEDMVVSLGRSSDEKLLGAASQCANNVLRQAHDPIRFVFVFDCAGRKEYLKEKFSEEIQRLDAAACGGRIVGVLSMGEVANVSKNSLELCNCTCVVGAY